MSQQSGVIVMIDVAAAIEANTLEGNTYIFDNMKLQGSKGHGTGKFTSIINGSQWSDGSQANEQVLNWAQIALGSIPTSVPKTFREDKSRRVELQVLEDFKTLAERLESPEPGNFTNVTSVVDEIKRISDQMGARAKLQNKFENAKRELPTLGEMVMDITGELITPSEEELSNIMPVSPLITNIRGEAVDKKVMYVAQYGSPDLVTDGWYWCANIDSSKVGTYSYIMDIQLHKYCYIDGELTLVPVDLTYEAFIEVRTASKVNGFTGAGERMLPIP